MVVSIELTRSVGERATLRKLLEQWRGQAFTAKELASFNLKNLLGKACLLTLVHKTSQAGRNYCAIQGMAKLPKGMKAPAKTENTKCSTRSSKARVASSANCRSGYRRRFGLRRSSRPRVRLRHRRAGIPT